MNSSPTGNQGDEATANKAPLIRLKSIEPYSVPADEDLFERPFFGSLNLELILDPLFISKVIGIETNSGGQKVQNRRGS